MNGEGAWFCFAEVQEFLDDVGRWDCAVVEEEVDMLDAVSLELLPAVAVGLRPHTLVAQGLIQ